MHRRLLQDRIECVAHEYLSQRHAPGISIAVEFAGSTCVVAAGFSDARTGCRCSPETQFCVGSVTKQFVAAAVLRLASLDRLSLDDPACRFFPQVDCQSSILLRHLLSHISGVAGGKNQAPCEDQLPEIALCLSPEFDAGSDWRYSNVGYAILARVLECLTAEKLADHLTEHVFTPSGLARTTVGPHGSGFAVGHRRVTNTFGSVESASPTSLFGSGSVFSTASDLVHWARSLRNGAIMDPLWYDVMSTPVRLNDGTAIGYGMGQFVTRFLGHRELSHDGNNSGFSAQLAVYPEADLKVAVLTNGARHDAEKIEKSLTRFCFGVAAVSAPELEVDSRAMAVLEGEYVSGSARARIWIDSERLWVLTPGGSICPLLHQGNEVFVQESDPDIQLGFANSVLVVTRGEKMLGRFTKAS